MGLSTVKGGWTFSPLGRLIFRQRGVDIKEEADTPLLSMKYMRDQLISNISIDKQLKQCVDFVHISGSFAQIPWFLNFNILVYLINYDTYMLGLLIYVAKLVFKLKKNDSKFKGNTFSFS